MTGRPAGAASGRRARTWAGRLALVAVVVATVAGLVVHPVGGGVMPEADRVIVAGAVGLRWDDVDPARTPRLWRLAETGAIGSLSVRSAHQPTCAADGWLTLGAGNWASATTGQADGGCRGLDVSIERDGVTGAHLPDFQELVRYNQWDLPWGAVPGALSGSVGCTLAVGEGAAVAAARSYGRIDRYRPSLPSDPGFASRLLDDDCELTVIDLGTVTGTGAARRADVRRLDEYLARVLRARPPDALLTVVGVADRAPPQHLHLAVAEGPGVPSGWLTSDTTGRTGYLELVDIAPTVLTSVDRPVPESLFAGHPLESRPGRPERLADAVAGLVAAKDQAELARPVSSWFLAGLTLAQLALFVAVVPLLRRPGPDPGARPRWWRRLGPVLLVAASLAVPVALATGGVPWWRAPVAGGVFALASLAVLAVASVLVARTPLSRGTLSLLAVGAGVGAAAVTADLLTGSWLQLHGVVGYSTQQGRYAGLSDTGLGVMIAGTLLVAGCVAEHVPRWWRPLAVATVGAGGVVLVGSPYLGAEIGGAFALGAGVCVAAALSTGGWLTLRRVGWTSLIGLAAVAAVAAFDLRRPVADRTGLGGMLGQFADGTAGFGLQRVSLANAEALTGSPLTVLAIGAGGFLWFALLRPWGGLRRLFGVHPALRAVTVGAVTAALVGGVLVGAALTVAGAAAAVGLPLLTFAALRLRERSTERFRQRLDRPVGAGTGRRG